MLHLVLSWSSWLIFIAYPKNRVNIIYICDLLLWYSTVWSKAQSHHSRLTRNSATFQTKATCDFRLFRFTACLHLGTFYPSLFFSLRPPATTVSTYPHKFSHPASQRISPYLWQCHLYYSCTQSHARLPISVSLHPHISLNDATHSSPLN